MGRKNSKQTIAKQSDRRICTRVIYLHGVRSVGGSKDGREWPRDLFFFRALARSRLNSGLLCARSIGGRYVVDDEDEVKGKQRGLGGMNERGEIMV